MKMKRSLAAVLAAVITLGAVGFAASAEERSSASVTFCVGDSTLMINSNPLEVVAPYVVGEGTTLVPLRVISETFGAKVDWLEEYNTATVTYRGTTLAFTIGSKDCAVSFGDVNFPTVSLMAAPELFETENGGYTMVPLRFIAEAFGAFVGYDDASERITIVLNEGMSAYKSGGIGNISFEIPVSYASVYTDEASNIYLNLSNPNENLAFYTSLKSELDIDETKDFSEEVMNQLKSEAEGVSIVFEKTKVGEYDAVKMVQPAAILLPMTCAYFVDMGDTVLIVSHISADGDAEVGSAFADAVMATLNIAE